MDRLFIGDIVQTVWEENDKESNDIISKGDIHTYIIKKNAILYGTKNGSYVDIEELKKKDYNRILKENNRLKLRKKFLILPAKSLSELESLGNSASPQGIFVNLDTLKKYKSKEKLNSKSLLNIR